jgi:hypothetical protein
MKKTVVILLLVAMLVSLTGCFGPAPQGTTSTEPAATSSKSPAVEKMEKELAQQALTPLEDGTLTMPRVDIVTVSTDENVMDFVTKPVDRFTSQSIASYTPGYVTPIEPYYEACKITVTDKTNVNAVVDENGRLTSYKADVDSDANYAPDTEVVKDGYFHESEFRSAPYFDIQIDGIELLNAKF